LQIQNQIARDRPVAINQRKKAARLEPLQVGAPQGADTIISPNTKIKSGKSKHTSLIQQLANAMEPSEA